ncbi:unnamed protein product [Blepharisma stoltei]|uniref:Uncharacterized protein n=1 Tax=Blepharisma stoltei TaxID=1481888 RepID=A0AAU9KMF1_9CILI|nr:unnamed protein product [Blepharisma stoltei]
MDASTEIVQDPNLSIKKKLLAKALKNEIKCSTLLQRNSPCISNAKAPKLILKNVLDKDDKKSCLLTERTRKIKKLESRISGSETTRSLSRKQEIQKSKKPARDLRSITPINKKETNFNKNPLKNKEISLSKPQSLAKLEGYFSEICSSIESTSKIEDKLMQKAEYMQETLKECLTAVPDLSLQFYILMSSILREIQDIYREKSYDNVCVLAQKLLQLGLYLENNKFLQKNKPKDIKEELLADFNEKISKNDQDLEATATFNEGELQSIKEQSSNMTISDNNGDSLLDVSFSDKIVNITFSPKGEKYNEEDFIHSSSIVTRTEPTPKSQKQKNISISFANPLSSFNKDIKNHRRIISSQPKKNISHDFKNCLDHNFLPLEKFKEFLSGKISVKINELKAQKYDPIKLKNEVYSNAIEKREELLKEAKGDFEDIEVIIMSKPGYEKRFSAEVIRTQRNFEESNRRKQSVNWTAKDIHNKKRKLEAVLNRFKR